MHPHLRHPVVVGIALPLEHARTLLAWAVEAQVRYPQMPMDAHQAEALAALRRLIHQAKTELP